MLFYELFVCKCVLPPGDNPIAVNKYIISYHIIVSSRKVYTTLRNHKTVYTQQFIVVIYKDTHFGYKRQPSSDVTFQVNLKPDDGWILLPKYVAVYITTIQCCV